LITLRYKNSDYILTFRYKNSDYIDLPLAEYADLYLGLMGAALEPEVTGGSGAADSVEKRFLWRKGGLGMGIMIQELSWDWALCLWFRNSIYSKLINI
jgi:hypothetical protein